nr:immunoglobulin light chain junction region [Macaca mulatta]MOX17000.1 immunoglobulin light chain junction region [Macaca mulatta]MOX17074.1 immunoglobulin light chain junction region [Macaca mulatta]MOX17088.1 immunoglobulin light chain junction region [Macaca mulatta]MOX17273.1 immunoglobulin light chain junction region [Macaca mulatta]
DYYCQSFDSSFVLF